MPIDISNLNLKQMDQQPQKLAASLTFVENELNTDPKDFAANYQWLLKLRTLKSLHAIENIDQQWYQMIETLTTNSHKLLNQDQPIPPLKSQIKFYWEPRLTLIQHDLLAPIQKLNFKFINEHELFWFSMNVFDDCAMNQINWTDLKTGQYHASEHDPQGYALINFLKHQFRIQKWQRQSIHIVIEQYQTLNNQNDPEMNAILNHHLKW